MGALEKDLINKIMNDKNLFVDELAETNNQKKIKKWLEKQNAEGLAQFLEFRRRLSAAPLEKNTPVVVTRALSKSEDKNKNQVYVYSAQKKFPINTMLKTFADSDIKTGKDVTNEVTRHKNGTSTITAIVFTCHTEKGKEAVMKLVDQLVLQGWKRISPEEYEKLCAKQQSSAAKPVVPVPRPIL